MGSSADPSSCVDCGDAEVPFLKWAGGKRWLVPILKRRLADALSHSGRYIEPFLGGGAIYFSLRPRRALLSDINGSLVEAFRSVRDEPAEVARLLAAHDESHSETYYYETRSRRFRNTTRRAAQFIYLNRTCWNGLYRVNKLGEFNVPIGTKTTALLKTDAWLEHSDLLSGASLRVQDFEVSIDSAATGDLIFADPPYTVKHNFNGFIKYNESLFSWEDQIRLRDALVRAIGRGARVVATNANHASVRELYQSPIFNLSTLKRNSKISADPAYRGKFGELLIVGAK